MKGSDGGEIALISAQALFDMIMLYGFDVLCGEVPLMFNYKYSAQEGQLGIPPASLTSTCRELIC